MRGELGYAFNVKDTYNMELYHGDCLEIMPTLPSGSVDMILADLPYGVTRRNKWDKIIPMNALWDQYRRIIKMPNGVIALTATQPFATKLIMAAPDLFRYDLVWEKSIVTGFLNAKKMPMRSHESVLLFYHRLPTYNPQMTLRDKPLSRAIVKGGEHPPAPHQTMGISTRTLETIATAIGGIQTSTSHWVIHATPPNQGPANASMPYRLPPLYRR